MSSLPASVQWIHNLLSRKVFLTQNYQICCTRFSLIFSSSTLCFTHTVSISPEGEVIFFDVNQCKKILSIYMLITYFSWLLRFPVNFFPLKFRHMFNPKQYKKQLSTKSLHAGKFRLTIYDLEFTWLITHVEKLLMAIECCHKPINSLWFQTKQQVLLPQSCTVPSKFKRFRTSKQAQGAKLA